MSQIAFLGGTGREGIGLALRFARAGEHVIIGSRRAERAETAARTLIAHLGASASPLHVRGSTNHAAARAADVIVLTLPFPALETVLTEIAPALSGKIILDVVNPLTLSGGIFKMIPVPAGSAAERIQQLVPDALLVSGFKHLSAKELGELDQPLRGDVLLCSDASDAKRYFERLIARIPRLRAVDAGPLANARHLESIAALLLHLNRHYRAVTSIHILGLNV